MKPLSQRLIKASLFLLTLIFLCFQQNIHAQQTTARGANGLQAHFRGKTKPLRELAPMPATDRHKQADRKANKPNFVPPNFINYERRPAVNPDALPIGNDPVRQDNLNRVLGIPVAPNLVFEGIDENTSQVGVPDTNGDASPEHYIQIVNSSWFQVFDKEGNALTPPTSANTLWSQINQQSFSDPVIMYDEAAARWLITDLANFDEVLYGVSETSDPLGAWNLYTLNTPGFADYPKYGIWPNAYIFTINEGDGTFPVYALNRQQILAGESTVSVQRIEIPDDTGGFPTATPMDWNSPMPPPTDEMFAVRLRDDAWGGDVDLLEVWTLNLDWDSLANTSATLLALPTAPYDTDGCSIDNGAFECIPQPGTSQGIDGIMTVVMNNVCYWNYGTHESAVLTFSVDAGNDVAGIRWMELRRMPGGDWEIYQEGTYAPEDGVHRFIGSIAINGKGDIALAYSVSGENTFPSLRYTGRRENDPLGEMTIDEFEFATGEGVRTGPRFGDYAHMSVDPLDGSFWFTSEYVKEDGSFSTKIVNFSLRRDTFDIAPISLVAPQDAPDLTDNEPVTIEITNLGLEPATEISVGYVFENNAPVVEMAAIDTLFPDSSYVHTFASNVDMSVIGDYHFKIFTGFAEDQNVQNDTLRRLRKKLARLDAGITDILGLDGGLCDSTANALFVLTNFGTDTLTSVTIEHQLNGGNTVSTDWTGSLATGESTPVEVLLDPLVSGTNTLSANILSPNNLDDQIPSNDNYARDFQVVLGGVGITLELNTDLFPEETSWQLADDNGTVLFVGGPYPGQQQELITETWCLQKDSCYNFTIFDAYGDGLTAYGVDGSYAIVDAEGNELAAIININFGASETNAFCLREPCALAIDIDVTDESMSNDNNGAILITITSGVSPFTFSIDGGATTQEEPLFSNLAGAVYNVVVTDANGCSVEQEVTVETLVAAHDISQEYSISVYPNPSENGVFWLKVEGLNGRYPQLDLQIVDALGRPVSYETLTAFDNYHKGLVSLHNFPAGVYYIRFANEKVNELVKVVRL
ncbi:MAG TPA: T9SS type A sorting domain-containing protein [Bacteroidetes bacterium]|nr:T9SS type A sorting domain-containing protein [Bacteroidota bacterium]